MIDAREARIVYEGNEYKNDIRDILEAQKKAEQEAQEKTERLKKTEECDTILQPIYDKIAEAAADGYNSIVIYLSDYSYKQVKYCYTHEYWGSINVRPLSARLVGYGNMPDQRHTFTHLVADVLEFHGYNTEITREYWGYSEYDEIVVTW